MDALVGATSVGEGQMVTSQIEAQNRLITLGTIAIAIEGM